MSTSKADAIKIINKSKSLRILSFAEYVKNQNEAMKIVSEAIRNKETIILLR